MKKRDGKSGQEKIDFKEQNASLLKQIEALNREVAIRDIALKSARVGLRIADLEGRILFTNADSVDLLGYSEADRMGRSAFEVIHPDDLDRAIQYYDWMLKHPEKDETSSFDYRLRHKQGHYIWAHAEGRFVRKNGKPEMVVFTVWDINERKKTVDALQESENRYKQLAELLPQFIYETDLEGRITFANRQALETFGYEREELIGKIQICDLFVAAEKRRFQECLNSLKKRETRFAAEFTALRRDQSTFCVILYSASIYRDGSFLGMRGMIADISSQKHMEDQLHALTARLNTIREEERTCISREIHDVLGQAMTSLKFDLSWPSKNIPEEKKGQTEKAKAMLLYIDEIIQMIRKISTELRPPILDDFGLKAAMEWQAEDFQLKTGITCSLKADFAGEIDLQKEKAICVFRIFQEALTNVARHAKADRVMVNFKKSENRLVMQIRDNGRGISQNEVINRSSLGITGMQERAFSLGGRLNIQGRPGQGTVITCSIPC